MPEISVSEDQRERLQWVQNRLADDVAYGHVRACDAVEYLLDRYDEANLECAESPPVAEPRTDSGGRDPTTDSDDEATPADGPDPSTSPERQESEDQRDSSDPRPEETSVFEVHNGVTTRVVRMAEVGGDREDDGESDAPADESTGTEGDRSDSGQQGTDARVPDDEASADESDETSESDEAEGTGRDDTVPSPPSGGDSRLNSVMSLLEDNDDVWREAGGGEEKYEVDLPDGGTERARTKDDVRALLFKHYR